MLIAALCTDIPQFHAGRILDPEYAERFPGAAVFPAFAQALREDNWEVMTGDQLLDRSTGIDMSQIFVVQEEESATGQALLARGAEPAVILSGESPLYARDFYRNLPESCKRFPHRVLFTGAHKAAGEGGLNHPLLFPAFHAGQEPLFIPWTERKHLILLAGNKYWRHTAIPWPHRLKRLVRETSDRTYTKWVRDNQLHDQRLALVAFFNSRGKVDVFGSGWQSLTHLPLAHQEALGDLTPGTVVRPGSHAKQSLLSSYKFTLTVENFKYPGYVTEKIFDALAAGSIPVYLGAPDIESFVPREAFIDLRDFSSSGELDAALDDLDETTATEMIAAGRRFLESEQGHQHSFENRGRFFAELVTGVAATR